MNIAQLERQLDTLRQRHEDLSRRFSLVAPTKSEKAELAEIEDQMAETIKGINSAEMDELRRQQGDRQFRPAYPWENDEAEALAKPLRAGVKALQAAEVGLAWIGLHDSARSGYLATRFPAAVRRLMVAYAQQAREYADLVGRQRRDEFHRDEAFARLWGE